MPARKHDLYYSGQMCAASPEKQQRGARTTAATERRCGAAMRVSTIMGSIARSNADADPDVSLELASSNGNGNLGCVCAGRSVCESHVPLGNAGHRYTVLPESCSPHHVYCASHGVCYPRARGHKAGRPSPTSSHTRKLISNAHGTQQILPRPFSRFLLMKSSHLEHRLPMIRLSLWTTNAKFTNSPTRPTEIRKFH